MKQVVVRLKGGLGNQLFQYARGKSIAEKYNACLAFDIGWYQDRIAIGNNIRTLGLGALGIDLSMADESIMKKINDKRRSCRTFRRIASLAGIHPLVFMDSESELEKVSQYNWNIMYISGYWQRERYFSDVALQIKKELNKAMESKLCKDSPLLQSILDGQSVAIHIRRGDYSDKAELTERYGLCGLEYYLSAVLKIRSTVENPVFYVFSDDLEWVNRNLGGIVPRGRTLQDYGLSVEEEFYLMSRCKHFIVANSTYSWWAAWLGTDSSKIVIAPVPWYRSVAGSDDAIPQSCIKMPAHYDNRQ